MYVGNVLNFTFKTSYDNLFNFLNSIMTHVGHTAFATLQIELYRVVDYDRKWSTKFNSDCMLGTFYISLLRRLLIIINNFQNIWPTAFATTMNWTMQWTIIASSLQISGALYVGKLFYFSFFQCWNTAEKTAKRLLENC